MNRSPTDPIKDRPNPDNLRDSDSIFTSEIGEVRPDTDGSDPDEAVLAQEFRQKHDYAKGGSEAWRYHARRAFNYYENDQRPPEIRDDDDAIYMILNVIRNRVDTRVGILSSAKPRSELTARGIKNEDTTRGFRDLMEFASDKLNFDTQVVHCIKDMTICGLSALKLDIDYEKKMDTQHGPVDGDLDLSVQSGLEIYLDPGNKSPSIYGKRGAEYFTIEEEVAQEELLMAYPKKAYRIKGADDRMRGATTGQSSASSTRDFARDTHSDQGDDDSRGSIDRDHSEPMLRRVTIWYQRREDTVLLWEVDAETGKWEAAIDVMGEPVSADNISDSDPNYWIQHQVQHEWWTAAIVDDVLLYNHKGQFEHGMPPYVFFCGTLHHDEATPFGEVHRLIDAQDFFNKINSLIVDNAIRNNNSGWMVEDGALDANAEQDLEERGSEPGFILKTRPEALSTGAIKRLEPGQLSSALYTIQNALRTLLDELSSLYQTQRGGMPYETSGKAIIALQQAGDTALVMSQRSIEASTTLYGRLLLSMIQQFYSFEKAWSISDQVRDESYHYLTSRGWDESQGKASLALYKLMDGDVKSGKEPEAKLLLKDFSAAQFSVKVTMGTGHERSREQKIEDAKMVLETTGGVPSAVRHVLTELEVPEKSEILSEMSGRDQLMQITQALEQNGGDPAVIGQFAEAMSDPTMSQILTMLLSQPDLLMKAVSESQTFMQMAQQQPIDDKGQPQGGPQQGQPSMGQPQGQPLSGPPQQIAA